MYIKMHFKILSVVINVFGIYNVPCTALNNLYKYSYSQKNDYFGTYFEYPHCWIKLNLGIQVTCNLKRY